MTNIGNGFIEKGARALLEGATEANIIETSAYNRHRLQPLQDNTSNITHLAEFFDPDVAVLPGCVLYEHALKMFKDILISLHDHEIPIILLGVGGGNYEPETKAYVREYFSNIPIEAIITRDSTAYEAYNDLAAKAYDGIDCAYWIDDWYEPPNMNKSFVVSCFEKGNEPKLKTESLIIRPKHRAIDAPAITLQQILSETPLHPHTK
jgi:hypothetical protein